MATAGKVERRSSSGSKSSDQKEKPTTLLTISKLKTLPRVSEELFRVQTWYRRIKTNHYKIGKLCALSEWLAYSCVILVHSILKNSPWYLFCLRKIRLVDELVCHQLEFAETHLKQINTEPIYQPGGVIERVYLMVCLSVRLLFIFPRLACIYALAALDVTNKEAKEDLRLFIKIVSTPSIRRSQRIKSKRNNRSPGKKRKHEETESPSLPAYFYVHEYSQDSDPDFVPDSDGEDTEMTSASDRSHDDDDDDDSGDLIEEEQDKKMIKELEASSKLENLNEDIAPHQNSIPA